MAVAGRSAKSIYQPEGWSQRDQRNYIMLEDNHGREWGVSIEVKTGDAVGLYEPQFAAPWIPEQKYLSRPDKRRPYDLFIDYKRMKADLRIDRRDWEREGRQLMRKMRGKAYDPSEEFGEDVLDIIGEPPQAIEPILAAEQGNSWILGRSKKVDKRLLPFLPVDRTPEEVHQEREGDWGDLDEEIDPGSAGRHRQAVKSNRPEPRLATRGTGRRKGKPPRQPAGVKRERYPKGHPRAGQWMPLELSA